MGKISLRRVNFRKGRIFVKRGENYKKRGRKRKLEKRREISKIEGIHE